MIVYFNLKSMHVQEDNQFDIPSKVLLTCFEAPAMDTAIIITSCSVTVKPPAVVILKPFRMFISYGTIFKMTVWEPTCVSSITETTVTSSQDICFTSGLWSGWDIKVSRRCFINAVALPWISDYTLSYTTAIYLVVYLRKHDNHFICSTLHSSPRLRAPSASILTPKRAFVTLEWNRAIGDWVVCELW